MAFLWNLCVVWPMRATVWLVQMTWHASVWSYQQFRAHVWPWFRGTVWPWYRGLNRRMQIIVGCVTGVVLISCCALGAANSQTPSNTTSATTASTQQQSQQPTATTIAPFAEHLTFSGDISGLLATGDNPQPATHNNPTPSSGMPNATQCATFAALPGSDTIDDFVGVVVGNVASKPVAAMFEINTDQTAYTNPGTPLLLGSNGDGGSVSVYAGNQQWLQTFGPTQQTPQIVLGSDRRSGTVDAWMTTGSQYNAATMHLQGQWRCGPGTSPSSVTTAIPTHAPVAVATQPPAKPTATTAPRYPAINGNPYDINFQCCHLIYGPPGDVCNWFNCIASFWNGTGYMNECADGTYSLSGGHQGDCSRHGDELRPVYKP